MLKTQASAAASASQVLSLEKMRDTAYRARRADSHAFVRAWGRAVRHAVKLCALPRAAVMVAWALADRINHTTGQLNPPLSEIGRDCGLSKSSVVRAIRALAAAGLLVISPGGGDGRERSAYGLTLPQELAEILGVPCPRPPVDNSAPGVSPDDTPEVPPDDTPGVSSGDTPIIMNKPEEERESNGPADAAITPKSTPQIEGLIFLSARTSDGYSSPTWDRAKALWKAQTGRVLSPTQFDAGYGQWLPVPFAMALLNA